MRGGAPPPPPLPFLLPLKALFAIPASASEKGVKGGGMGGEGIVGEGSVTMRRGGPHPCVPGVPFMILTLHSGMKAETEEGTHQQKGGPREGRGGRWGGGQRAEKRPTVLSVMQEKCCSHRLCTHVRFPGLCPPAGVCCLVLIQVHAFYAR